ncbi:MAG: Trk family potassium uptake protein [Chloroflexi bacterium]|nr:Trk family potassium uptake protein [Chloroflexota bacterium]
MEQGWRRRLGDRVVRHPRLQELEPVHIPPSTPRTPTRRFESPLVLMYGFGCVIAIGTLVLWLPFFNTEGGFTPFLTALFSATSAVTTTGLVVEESATYWNRGGQVVLIVLLTVGGLGFMSAATFLLIVIAQRISLTNLLIMRESTGMSQRTDLVRLTIQVVAISLLIQLLAFVLFLWRFAFTSDPVFDSVGEAAWQAAFLSASAFNNAGFSILPDSASLEAFRTDLWILGGTAFLIILGGIGYTVLVDIARFKRFNRFRLDSRLIILVSLALWFLGMVGLFGFEFGNQDTLKGLPLGDQLTDAFFQSVSGRTAGFSSIDFAATEQHTNFFFIGLMFIGGASGSTASGIKVNTFAVILVAVLASIRGRPQVEVFGREITPQQVQRALSIGVLGLLAVFVVAVFLTLAEGFPFINILFETVSAFANVGLSTGITPDLSAWGQTILVLAMFVGRLGPLTFALALARREPHAVYRYSVETVKIG